MPSSSGPLRSSLPRRRRRGLDRRLHVRLGGRLDRQRTRAEDGMGRGRPVCAALYAQCRLRLLQAYRESNRAGAPVHLPVATRGTMQPPLRCLPYLSHVGAPPPPISSRRRVCGGACVCPSYAALRIGSRKRLHGTSKSSTRRRSCSRMAATTAPRWAFVSWTSASFRDRTRSHAHLRALPTVPMFDPQWSSMQWANSKVFFFSQRASFFPGAPTPPEKLPVMVHMNYHPDKHKRMVSCPLASASLAARSQPSHAAAILLTAHAWCSDRAGPLVRAVVCVGSLCGGPP